MNKTADDFFDETLFTQLSNKELIDVIKKLHLHNEQLKNIIKKQSKLSNKAFIKNKKPFDFTKCSFRHVLLKFLYLGWDYQGYACQEDTINTIENYLFEALLKTCLIKDRSSSNYHRCGRTDKGVSSFGQTISINLRSNYDFDSKIVDNEINYCKVLNKVLPDNIRCIGWCPVPTDFSARFNCEYRTYKYYFTKANLNIQKMKEGANYLIGTHDFRNFCKMDVSNGVVVFIRNILFVDISPVEINKDENEYSLFVFTIKGNAFLWHQIRCIIGILFLIGENRESPEIVKELLDIDNNKRKPEYNIAAEEPLNLFECTYDSSLNWIYEENVIKDLYQHLYKKWANYAVKETMIKDMLKHITSLTEENLNKELSVDFLLCGAKSKQYKPLLSRQKCESLENRIQHFSKKRKFDNIKCGDNNLKC